MDLYKTALLVCVLVLLLRGSEGTSNNKKSDSSDDRSDCDHILPLMMMLGGPPTASLPSVWMLGLISLGVVVFFGSGSLGTKGCYQEEEERRKVTTMH